uniref:Uncharacterized protein n=1 Tax=Oryza rufipogon TaxID=4529 RepID=A0A0E0P555_ORYRU
MGTAAQLAAICTIRGKQLGGGGKKRQEGSLILTVRQLRSGTVAVAWTMTGSKGMGDWGKSRSQDGRKASVLRVSSAEGWLDGRATVTSTQQYAAVWLE